VGVPFRVGGHGSKRVQRGGFVSELVERYLAQHDVQQVTINKLRWLLAKATLAFGERRIGELTSQEIPPGE
jgi:hypothetical protein